MTFTCEVNKPDEKVVWLHNDTPIVPSKKLEVHASDRKHSLTVHDLKPEDSGQYTARVGTPPRSNDTTASLTISGE